MEDTSKVYILTDSQNRIVQCEGGYTLGNIADPEPWIFIDEGCGDRYNLCQGHYFEGGLYTEDGICRYIWDAGVCRLRTEEEIAADRHESEWPISLENRVATLEMESAEAKEALDMILSGVTE
jgi:hypothetical protein